MHICHDVHFWYVFVLFLHFITELISKSLYIQRTFRLKSFYTYSILIWNNIRLETQTFHFQALIQMESFSGEEIDKEIKNGYVISKLHYFSCDADSLSKLPLKVFYRNISTYVTCVIYTSGIAWAYYILCLRCFHEEGFHRLAYVWFWCEAVVGCICFGRFFSTPQFLCRRLTSVQILPCR